MNIVIYTRVSTDEQAQLGFSLRHQEESLRKYCAIKGYQVINHFQDDFSAKTFNRPEWLKLFEYVKRNRRAIDLVIFTKWDRFSRNSENALTVIRKLNDFGVQVNSIEQPLDLSIPDNKLVLAMYLAIPEVENDKNSARTRDCMRKAQKEGCFVNRAPYGYKGVRVNGKASLAFNDDTYTVKKAFEEVAKGIEPVEIIRKKMKLIYACKLQKQQFYNMLRNVVYKGCILIKEYKKEEEQIVQGLHDPIVSDKLFNKVQDVLIGRKRNAKLPSLINDDFPLKKNLICPKCNNQITGSKSLGNGGYYFYYHCTSKCKVRYKRDDVHRKISELIKGISFNKGMESLYKTILKDCLKEDVQKEKAVKEKFEKELKSIDDLIESAEDKLMSNEINKEQFDKVMTRYFSKRKECENNILALSIAKNNSGKYVNKVVELMCNLENVFNHLSGGGKASFLSIIYPENLIIENNGFRTNSRNEVIDVMTNIYGGLENVEIKKAIPKNGFSSMAPPLGLEPRTL